MADLGDWLPTRWFRIRQPDGSLWMETSDESEAVRESERTGWPVELLWKRAEYAWAEYGQGEPPR